MKFLPSLAAVALISIGFTSCKSLRGNSEPEVRPMDMSQNTAHLRIEVNGKIKTVVIQLNPDAAPRTVENFKTLVASGFYNNLAFHRVIPNYLVQTGDPGSKNFRGKGKWGLGGPGYTVPAEIGLKHKRGSVAMARLGNDLNPSKESNGSQFYIALADLPSLDGQYSVFGEVISGIEVLDEMATVPTDANDIPTQRTEVYDLRLVRPDAVVAAPRKVERKSQPEIDPDAGPMKRFIQRVW